MTHKLIARALIVEAQFYCVHCKGGCCVDILPGGSIATGQALCVEGRRKAGWRWVSPDIQSLWKRWIVGV